MPPIDDRELFRRLQLIAKMNRSPEAVRRTGNRVREALERRIRGRRTLILRKMTVFGGVAAGVLLVMGILTFMFGGRHESPKKFADGPSIIPPVQQITESTHQDVIRLEDGTGKKMLTVQYPSDQPKVRLYVFYPMIQPTKEKL